MTKRTVAPPDTFIFWLSHTAEEMRKEAGKRQVHVAAAMSRDQSTVYKFEQGKWLRDPELAVAAYAEAIGVEPVEIWERAVIAWRDHGRFANVDALSTLSSENPVGSLTASAREAQKERHNTRPRARRNAK